MNESDLTVFGQLLAGFRFGFILPPYHSNSSIHSEVVWSHYTSQVSQLNVSELYQNLCLLFLITSDLTLTKTDWTVERLKWKKFVINFNSWDFLI